ncbi:hypothetical protein RHMOL_Rhmol09G0263500 [Rhododendron molle]|uniref:Uncharacterized protein n=1 Tax=Rhododendron molle TaxID=49168 RepID=A0ACC0MIN7_RHOML|nr:hypothetical protein RHMOL_Rhmol09G0263500 [Rhododendron molle]
MSCFCSMLVETTHLWFLKNEKGEAHNRFRRGWKFLYRALIPSVRLLFQWRIQSQQPIDSMPCMLEAFRDFRVVFRFRSMARKAVL